MKILLPIDGLDDAKLIVSFVSNYRWSAHAQFKVLHVIGSSETESESLKAKEEAQVLVDAVAKQVKQLVASAETLSGTCFGWAVQEIIEEANKWQADMIVLGHRAHPDGKYAFIGSIASGVAAQAPCSVAVIRPNGKGL